MLWPHPPRPRPAAAAPEVRVDEPTLGSVPLVVQRPDGYYWRSAEGRAEVGPFESVAEAEADLNASADDSPEPGESLYEAEQELGIADWLDSETGELAEDTRTRLEDH